MVNGYPVAAGLQRLEALLLRPGRYVVEATQAGRQPVQEALQVEAGGQYDLSALLMGAPELQLLEGAETGETQGPGMGTWLSLGLGAAAAVAGAGLLGKAAMDRREVERAIAGDGPSSMSQARAHELEAGANTLSTVGAVLAGVGSVAAGAGLVWLLTSESEAVEGEGAIAVIPTAGGALLRWAF
jgi:hypothetical protein